MSIKRIIKMIDAPNLVKKVMNRTDGEEKLIKIGKMVCQNHQDNEQSMCDWSDLIEDGMDVAKFDNKSTSYPWDGAANFKSPLITEAVRSFGDKAKTEIMSTENLVATKIMGMRSDEKNEAGDRVESYMNWQINTDMDCWRDEHTRLLYMLAAQGAIFKKTFYDSTEGCNRSDIIRYPNFSIDQECDNLLESNFTEIKHYKDNAIWERVKAGLWYEHKDMIPEGEDLDDEDFEFLEQYCYCDLDDDGYEEPYIITVHKNTQKVVRIVPRFDIDGVYVLYNNNTYNLKELVEATNQPQTEDPAFNAIQSEMQMEDIEKNSQLIRIVPMDIITYYGFIESTDGSFLGLGYLHALSSTVKGINKATNSLFNAGDLSNLQGGWLSKEHRDKRNGPYRTKPGVYKQTNITSTNLANSVMPFQFKEPSQTLLALTEGLKNEVKEMTSQFNYEQVLSPNIPAASVLGALQEGVIPTSSLLMNVVSSMNKEFQIMYDLNIKYTDPIIYQKLTGTDTYQQDMMEVEIAPTASAQASSQMQRIQLANAQLERLDLLLQVGGNPVPIIRDYYSALGTQNMDDIFPEQMTDEDAKVQQQMMQAQQQQVELQELQTQLLQAQVQQGNQEVGRKIAQTMADIQEMKRESARKDEESRARVAKMYADALLAKEKAETEDEKNAADLQLRAIQIMIDMNKEAS